MDRDNFALVFDYDPDKKEDSKDKDKKATKKASIFELMQLDAQADAKDKDEKKSTAVSELFTTPPKDNKESSEEVDDSTTPRADLQPIFSRIVETEQPPEPAPPPAAEYIDASRKKFEEVDHIENENKDVTEAAVDFEEDTHVDASTEEVLDADAPDPIVELDPEPATENEKAVGNEEVIDQPRGELIIDHEDISSEPENFGANNAPEMPEPTAAESEPQNNFEAVAEARMPLPPENRSSNEISVNENEASAEESDENPPPPPPEVLHDNNDKDDEPPTHGTFAGASAAPAAESAARLEVQKSSDLLGVLAAFFVHLRSRSRDKKIRRKYDKEIKRVEEDIEQSEERTRQYARSLETHNYQQSNSSSSKTVPQTFSGGEASAEPSGTKEGSDIINHLENKTAPELEKLSDDISVDQQKQAAYQEALRREDEEMNRLKKEKNKEDQDHKALPPVETPVLEKDFDTRHERMDEAAKQDIDDSITTTVPIGHENPVPISKILADRDREYAKLAAKNRDSQTTSATDTATDEIYKQSLRAGFYVGLAVALIGILAYVLQR